MHVCLFEDSHFKNFLPLVYLRPVFSLRCGARTLGEKIAAGVPPRSVSFHVREDIRLLASEECLPWSPASPVNTGIWFINARVVGDDHLAKLVRSSPVRSRVFMQGGTIAAAYLRKPDLRVATRLMEGEEPDQRLVNTLESVEFDGKVATYPWDLVDWNAEEIERDARVMRKSRVSGAGAKIYKGAHLLGRGKILLGRGTVVKPGAVLDAERGSIIIGRDVTIMPNAYIEGPAFIGDHSMVKVGAKIYHGTSIGPHSKVGGEVEASIIQSFSNKQHDGFLGHSYVGSWVNIGADTNTSDLKNTYGPVTVRLEDREVNTGRQFVGLTIGDHAKTGINVMFDTGTVVGISCNVYGAGLPAKFVPSFAWGGGKTFVTYKLEQALETARRVMARRNVAMTPEYEKCFRRVFALTGGVREVCGVVNAG